MMRHTLLILMLLACGMSASAQLTLKSEKGDFEARLIGRALFDGGVFFSDKTALGNSLEVYDVRLGTVVRFLERWTGKIELGFAKSKVSMKDVYIEYSDGKNLFKVGHCFEPFSLEYRIGTSDMKFNGAAVTGTAFGDRRRLGISYTYNCEVLTCREACSVIKILITRRRMTRGTLFREECCIVLIPRGKILFMLVYPLVLGCKERRKRIN